MKKHHNHTLRQKNLHRLIEIPRKPVARTLKKPITKNHDSCPSCGLDLLAGEICEFCGWTRKD